MTIGQLSLLGTVLAAVLFTCLAFGQGRPRAHPIPGYGLGDPALARSPLTLSDLARLEEVLLFSDKDRAALRASRAILEPRIEEILDVWYGFVAATPQLLESFADPKTGQPDAAYLAAVRKRFGQWILDTADARHDQDWLNYSHEIGLRHHRSKKNTTDGANAAAHIPMRYVLALCVPIATTLRPFLEAEGTSPEEVEAMAQAWTKSVWLQSILWCQPYARPGDF